MLLSVVVAVVVVAFLSLPVCLLHCSAQPFCGQVEKVTHGEAEALLDNLGKMAAAGTSLGSFSVSVTFLYSSAI